MAAVGWTILAIAALVSAALALSYFGKRPSPAPVPPNPAPPIPPLEDTGARLWAACDGTLANFVMALDRLSSFREVFSGAGFDTDAIYAISALETGNGHASAGHHFIVDNNNIMGITLYEGHPEGEAKYFASLGDCATWTLAMLQRPRYEPSYAVRSSGLRFIEQVSRDGYNESQSWRDSVSSIYRRIREIRD